MIRPIAAAGLVAVSLASVVGVRPLAAPVHHQTEPAARFELERRDVLIDDTIPIVVSGLTPGVTATLRLRGGPGNQWASMATFIADSNGRVDLTRMAPVKGGYKAADAMGLFWSAEHQGMSQPSSASDEDDEETSPEQWTLSAEVGGAEVARVDVRRRAVAATVSVKPVREAGLVGTFYEPPGGGRHPAFIVLSGSGGGVPPPGGPAGGLASRGYGVLALAYFGA